MSCGNERASPRDATARPAGAEVTRAAAPVQPAGRSCGTPAGLAPRQGAISLPRRGGCRGGGQSGWARGAVGSAACAGRGGFRRLRRLYSIRGCWSCPHWEGCRCAGWQCDKCRVFFKFNFIFLKGASAPVGTSVLTDPGGKRLPRASALRCPPLPSQAVQEAWIMSEHRLFYKENGATTAWGERSGHPGEK